MFGQDFSQTFWDEPAIRYSEISSDTSDEPNKRAFGNIANTIQNIWITEFILGKQSSQRVYIPYIFKRNTPLAETTIDTTPIDSEGNNKSHFEAQY